MPHFASSQIPPIDSIREEIITSVNKAAEDITGFEADRVCGKPLHYLMPDDMVSRWRSVTPS